MQQLYLLRLLRERSDLTGGDRRYVESLMQQAAL